MRILVAEDSPVIRKIVVGTLEDAGYEVIVASNGKEAFEKFKNNDVQMIITDWVMPEMEGAELCRQIRRECVDRYVYVILLTGLDSKADVHAGLQSGADDYLIKPVEPDQLMARIRTGERIFNLERRLHDTSGQLAGGLSQDPLTGVLSSSAVLDILDREIERASREERLLSIIRFRIDRFDDIVETHGRAAADKVVAAAAGRAKKVTRPYDVLGRLEDGSFLVIVPGPGAAETEGVADRIRATFAAQSISIAKKSVEVTVSLGVTEFSPAGDPSSKSLLDRAMDALEQAVKEGGNCVGVAPPPDPEDLEPND